MTPVLDIRRGARCLSIPAAFVVIALALFVLGARANAATFYVDNQNPAASDAGPGTAANPYRTISAAVTQHGAAGNTVMVKPGVYPEQVTIAVSGLAGSPFIVEAAGPGVVVDGADDFGTAAAWTAVSGGVYLARGVTWAPLQVFADGQRLAASTASPSLIPAGTFEYVAGTGLYANVGGENPGNHVARVGRRSYGFSMSGRSWVTLSGFEVTRCESRCFYVPGSCSNCEISGNTVTFAGTQGIYISGGSSLTVANNFVSDSGDHGIYLVSGVTGSVVRGNESSRNARPAVRAANGIHLYGSSGNRVEGNRLHDNQDTGLQINAGSNDNVCVQNLSWNNGDHGFDHLGSSGTIHVGDVAYGNYKDGFSLEGTAPGAQLHDCIAVNNGTTTGEYDLWVDATSTSGFVSDYNLFWNGTTQAPVKIASTIYATVAAYALASGNDGHSRQSDPRFTSPLAGDFHLASGSPAIDAATSAVANWPALDFDGRARYDDPATPNTGTGTVPYADLGALEYSGTSTSGTPPVAVLRVTPASGAAPLAVTADASGSSDPDGTIASYRFDFGDGASAGPQTSPLAGHTYAAGNWTARVTVTDNSGLTASATSLVSVTAAADHPPVVAAPATASVNESAKLTINVTASDPDGQSIASLTADVSGLPAGNNATFTHASDNKSGTLTWTPTYADAGSYSVTFRAANALAGTAATAITVSNVDRAPVVTAPGSVRVRPGNTTTFTVSAADPDGDAITSFTADLSKLPSGNNATFTTNAAKTSGTFSWTPQSGQNGSYTVTFRASNAKSGTASTTVQVRRNAALAASEPIGGTLALSNGYPNPSAGEVAFALDLPRASVVEWTVFDLQGRSVWSESRSLAAGRSILSWNGETPRGGRARAGLYVARVHAGGAVFTRRLARM